MTGYAHTKSTLDGYLKDVYADGGLEKLVPDFGLLYKMISFEAAKKLGRDFVKGVQLTREAGFTYGAGLQTLAGIVNGDGDDAKVRGASFLLQSGWSYDAAAALANGDKASFVSVTSHKFANMMEAAVYRAELQLLYGSAGLGITATDSAGDTLIAVTDTNKVVVPFTSATWSAGIWSGSEGAHISLYEVDSDTASAVEGNAAPTATVNKFQITAVDPANKAITVACKDATEAGKLVVELEDEAYNVFFYGAHGNEMVGLQSICGNTGTLFGINGANYSLFKGNSYSAGTANLTLKKVFLAVAQAVGRGLLEEVTCVVSPSTFATMANDESALRQYTGKIVTADRGVENIVFNGPNGKIAVMPHPMCKDEMAMIFPHKKASRIGSQDLSFKRPGGGDDMIQEMATQTGFEVRLYSEQALFIPCPNKTIIITGISNA